MEKDTFEEYVNNRYKKQMEFCRKASSINHKKYKFFQWLLIILSALTPILAGLTGLGWNHEGTTYLIQEWQVKVLVVVISSVVAIFTSALKIFKYQELSANYLSIHDQLSPEFFYYEFNAGLYSKEGIDKESLFVSRVESILKKEHLRWPQEKDQHEGL